MSRNQLWLDAFYNTSLHLKAECGVVFLALEDLAKDGTDRLLALLIDFEQSRLKILNGADLQCEITLPEMAIALCTFSMDGSLPGIAVGAGSSLYIYKNFKPYYKYNIPHGGPKYSEKAEITQIAALPRSSPDVSSSSLLLVGTEHHSLLIIDSHTFNAISRIELPGIPTFIKCTGYYDVEAIILVGTPDTGIFLLQSDHQPMEARPLISTISPVVDIAFNGNTIAIASSDHAIKFYTVQGQEIRKIGVKEFIYAITWVEMRNKDMSLLAVSLANGTVQFYRQSVVIEQLQFNTGIISMICGRFGREDGVLVMISKDGDLVVKILNRGYKMASQTSVNNATDEKSSVANSNKKKPLLPAKTKLFVDQAMREKEDPAKMYRLFQEGICRIHLRALREWTTTSSISNDIQQLTTEPNSKCIHLVAKLLGSGSRLMLHLLLQNISEQTIESLTIMLQVTDGSLVLERTYAKLYLLLPTNQHWIKMNVRDPTSQGGQVSVIVTKDMESSTHPKFSTRGVVVCSAKISISPTI